MHTILLHALRWILNSSCSRSVTARFNSWYHWVRAELLSSWAPELPKKFLTRFSFLPWAPPQILEFWYLYTPNFSILRINSSHVPVCCCSSRQLSLPPTHLVPADSRDHTLWIFFSQLQLGIFSDYNLDYRFQAPRTSPRPFWQSSPRSRTARKISCFLDHTHRFIAYTRTLPITASSQAGCPSPSGPGSSVCQVRLSSI